MLQLVSHVLQLRLRAARRKGERERERKGGREGGREREKERRKKGRKEGRKEERKKEKGRERKGRKKWHASSSGVFPITREMRVQEGKKISQRCIVLYCSNFSYTPKY